MVITLWDALDAGGMVRGGGAVLEKTLAAAPTSCPQPRELQETPRDTLVPQQVFILLGARQRGAVEQQAGQGNPQKQPCCVPPVPVSTSPLSLGQPLADPTLSCIQKPQPWLCERPHPGSAGVPGLPARPGAGGTVAGPSWAQVAAMRDPAAGLSPCPQPLLLLRPIPPSP